MLFELRPEYLQKFCGLLVVISLFVFPIVVVLHIPDNDRSRLLPQDYNSS